MKPLTKNAFKRIKAYDFRVFREQGERNRTRFYKFLVRRGRDMEVHAVAVKTRKDGTVAMKEVVRSSVEDPQMWLKDIALMPMSGYVVDWSKEKCGYKPEWAYRQWGAIPYSAKSCEFKLYVPTVNPEALRGLKRFRWCSYTENCGDILDFLKTYVEHPRIELLAKAGVGWYSNKTLLIKKLEKDKQFTAFFAKNIEAMKEHFYKVDEILRAYKLGLSLPEARQQVTICRRFHGVKVPKGIDLLKAGLFADSKNTPAFLYASYLCNCVRLGLDLGDTKVSFPRQLKARMKAIAEQCAVLDRAEKAELSRKMDADISAASAKLAKLEVLRGSFWVILPRKEIDFVREGKMLKHCVGNGQYSAKMARGESMVGFIRKESQPKVPFVTIEFVPGEKRPRQCYGVSGSRPSDDVMRFVNGRFFKTVNKISQKRGVS